MGQVRSSFEAIAAVSDTSGKTSLASQLNAYKQLSASFSSQSDAAIHMAMVNAFSSSSFFSRVQNVTDSYEQMSWAGRNGSAVSAVHAQINAFQSFADDDQTIIAALSQNNSYASTPAGYLSFLTDGLKSASTGDAIDAAAQSGNQSLYQSLIASLGIASDGISSFIASPRSSRFLGGQLNETA